MIIKEDTIGPLIYTIFDYFLVYLEMIEIMPFFTVCFYHFSYKMSKHLVSADHK